MKKTDAIISFVIGFLIGIFFFVVLRIVGIKIPYSWLLIVIFPPLTVFGMFVASWLGKRFLFILQAAKFALVGAFNTFVDLAVLNLLIWISGIAVGLPYSVFKGIAFLVSATNSYYWNKYWAFGEVEKGPGPKEFSKFFGTMTIGFFLNVGIASLVVNVVGPQFGISERVWASVGAFCATLIAWVWNFIGSKFFVFKK